MNNIVFLNFDNFTKEKTKFFNEINKILNKDKFRLVVLSDTDIQKPKFETSILNYKKFFIKGNIKQIKNILKLSKKKENEWEKTLKLYYENKNLKFIKNKINCLIYNYLYFLNKYRPSLAIVWTEYHPFCEIFKVVCNYFNINYLISERGLLNETIVLEKKGIYGKSYVTKKKILGYSNLIHYNKFIKIYEKLKDKWAFKINHNINKRKITNSKKTIFFAGTNEIWHGFYPYKNSETSPLYNSHFELLKDLSKISKKFENLEIIFKPHPKDRIFKLYENLIPKNITILRNVNAIDLIKKSDLFITIASSLICDAMFYNKPSIIVGKFELSNKNICYEIKKKNDLFKYIKLFYKNKLKKKDLKNWKLFVNFLLNDYLYNISKYKFGKLNANHFVEKLLKYKKINSNYKRYKLIEDELNKIELNIFFKNKIKENIKKLSNIFN